jgi:Tol biopolymer transport system component
VDVASGLEGDAFGGWWRGSERLAFGVFPSNGQTTADLLSQMYVVNADGSNRAPLGEFVQPQEDAGWDGPTGSPDGSSIVVFSPEGGARLLRASGGEPLDLGVTNTLKWSWSPDSRFLALDASSAEGSVVLVADVMAASGFRELTEGFWPRWSPDGDRIAVKRAEEETNVYTVRPDGSDAAFLGGLGSNDRGELTWSEDGSEVAYVRGASAVEYIYTIDLVTAAVTRSPRSLTEAGFPGVGSAIELSPDGKRVAFSNPGITKDKDDVPTPGWFLMAVRSGDVTQVSTEPRTGDLYWTDSGVRLAFSGGVSGVFVADPNGGAPRQVSASQSSTMAVSAIGFVAVVRLAAACGAGAPHPESDAQPAAATW